MLLAFPVQPVAVFATRTSARPLKTMQGKGLGSALPEKLREKINDPINFKPLTQDLAHAHEADVLIEVAKAIIAADQAGALWLCHGSTVTCPC